MNTHDFVEKIEAISEEGHMRTFNLLCQEIYADLPALKLNNSYDAEYLLGKVRLIINHTDDDLLQIFLLNVLCRLAITRFFLMRGRDDNLFANALYDLFLQTAKVNNSESFLHLWVLHILSYYNNTCAVMSFVYKRLLLYLAENNDIGKKLLARYWDIARALLNNSQSIEELHRAFIAISDITEDVAYEQNSELKLKYENFLELPEIMRAKFLKRTLEIVRGTAGAGTDAMIYENSGLVIDRLNNPRQHLYLLPSTKKQKIIACFRKPFSFFCESENNEAAESTKFKSDSQKPANT